MPAPLILDSVAALRNQVALWRAQGDSVGLVPTMGALHDGHIALVREAQRLARRSIVSIFVNPTQFAPTEDFSKYPRTFAADLEALTVVGADAVYAPQVADIYPPGFATTIVPEGPAKAGLEDAFRPTHFQGVATVVAKLLLQALPDVAIFGEKDFQQLAVVKQMARDLDLTARIIGHPTIRETDGVAKSSRNVYLSSEERLIAPVLFGVLQDCARKLRASEPPEDVLEAGRGAIKAAGFQLDYLALRDAGTLLPIETMPPEPARLLVAARIGAVRLIDNIAI